MDEVTIQVLSIIVLLLALVVTAVLPRRRYVLRKIAAYERMPALAGLAIESNRPLHISLGSAGIGGSRTLLALAGADLAYHLSERAAIGDVSPIISLSDASALPLGQDTLRRAYQSRGLSERYRAGNVRWYPSGSRSLAFAAAVTTLMAHEEVSSNVMVGSYGPELALVMDASYRRQVPVIGVSDQLEGQAIAYALSNQPLIGEEVFASPAYLDQLQDHSRETVTIDVLRWTVVVVLIIGVLAKIAEGA